jgi:hypothetical protein
MENAMDNMFAGFLPSCRMTLSPSTKNVTIRIMGSAATHSRARMHSMMRIHVKTMWDDSHTPYPASTKSMAMPRQAIIQKKETPLHSDLGSRTIIPAKKQNDTTNKIIAICHIPNCPSSGLAGLSVSRQPHYTICHLIKPYNPVTF